MPELPEVETTAADLRPQLLGERFTGVHVLWSRTVAAPEPSQFATALVGQSVRRVSRRGKFVLIELAAGDGPSGAGAAGDSPSSSFLIVHLRMTGQLRVEPAEEAPVGPHVRVWCELTGGRRLVFTDARKFGRMWLVHDPQTVLDGLGPEPLGPSFTVAGLIEQLRRRRAPIKPLLLDQTIVAGLGNIYADESLFLAGIHPLRPGASLSDIEIARLHAAIQQVLGEAIGQRGTTLRDYRPPYGERGAYQEHLRVYGHNKSEPCPNCGSPIVRIVIAQRSAHFCPHCQPAET